MTKTLALVTFIKVSLKFLSQPNRWFFTGFAIVGVFLVSFENCDSFRHMRRALLIEPNI